MINDDTGTGTSKEKGRLHIYLHISLCTRDIFSVSRRSEDEESCETSSRSHPGHPRYQPTTCCWQLGRRVVGEVICSIARSLRCNLNLVKHLWHCNVLTCHNGINKGNIYSMWLSISTINKTSTYLNRNMKVSKNKFFEYNATQCLAPWFSTQIYSEANWILVQTLYIRILYSLYQNSIHRTVFSVNDDVRWDYRFSLLSM